MSSSRREANMQHSPLCVVEGPPLGTLCTEPASHHLWTWQAKPGAEMCWT